MQFISSFPIEMPFIYFSHKNLCDKQNNAPPSMMFAFGSSEPVNMLPDMERGRKVENE
jgi:hypothetical protein